ncbi:hypothetical protein BN2475_130073 [Paraburkholderia ribeironis]|uniref:Uncharacterized protein n=1 Tax=Paraburkholderia ribeironis TaxID=1247936 RepID=A0A1N7RSG7_9BURK|nr:hypothetical protein BN2475_130073 [Paraburkholderia ribeironis]
MNKARKVLRFDHVLSAVVGTLSGHGESEVTTLVHAALRQVKRLRSDRVVCLIARSRSSLRACAGRRFDRSSECGVV